jgi:hypothetical protein
VAAELSGVSGGLDEHLLSGVFREVGPAVATVQSGRVDGVEVSMHECREGTLRLCFRVLT